MFLLENKIMPDELYNRAQNDVTDTQPGRVASPNRTLQSNPNFQKLSQNLLTVKSRNSCWRNLLHPTRLTVYSHGRNSVSVQTVIALTWWYLAGDVYRADHLVQHACMITFANLEQSKSVNICTIFHGFIEEIFKSGLVLDWPVTVWQQLQQDRR